MMLLTIVTAVAALELYVIVRLVERLQPKDCYTPIQVKRKN